MFGKKLDRKKTARAIASLRIMENKLRFIESKLESGIEEKMQDLMRINQLYGKEFAMQVAAELAERKRILANIKSMRISVERVRVKFETMLDMNATVDMAKEIIPLISDLKKNFSKAAPELSLMFSDFEEKLNELGIEIGSYAQFEGSVPVSVDAGGEVDSILREAAEVAKSREKGRLPAPP